MRSTHCGFADGGVSLRGPRCCVSQRRAQASPEAAAATRCRACGTIVRGGSTSGGLAYDPERERCSSSVARAARTRRPRSDARTRTSSSSRDFPIPTAPSMTRAARGAGRRRARRGADALDLVLAGRAASAAGRRKRGRVHAQIDRTPRAGRRAMFGAQCQGMCPMCGAPVGRTMAATGCTNRRYSRNDPNGPGTPARRAPATELGSCSSSTAGADRVPARMPSSREGEIRPANYGLRLPVVGYRAASEGGLAGCPCR